MSASIRYAVSVEVANLTEPERDALNSLIALLTDPQLRRDRGEFLRGRTCLVVESGVVTWADAPAAEPMFAEVLR